MGRIKVGTVAQLHRYPVKSFAGERLTECRFEAYGLYGDRSHAFVDESKMGFARFVTAREVPGMLLYRAAFADRPAFEDGSAFPEPRIEAPDGSVIGWNEALLSAVQTAAGREFTMIRHRPDEPGPLSVDEAGVMIVTDASLREAQRLWGKPLDERRFRANLIIRLDEDRPFAENGWVGRRLSVGEAILEMDALCTRCTMIGIDPDRLNEDSSLLRLLTERKDAAFGLYASVRCAGTVREGDCVYLEPDAGEDEESPV